MLRKENIKEGAVLSRVLCSFGNVRESPDKVL